MRRCAALVRHARVAAGVLVFAILQSGCVLVVPQSEALRDAWPPTLAQAHELDAVPFFPQDDNFCGPSALATTLTFAGVHVTQEQLERDVYLPGRGGSLQVEMEAAPRRHGIVSYRLDPSFEALLREVAAGHPVVVLQDYGVWPFSYWHYATVIGFDRARGEVVLRSGTKRRLVMPLMVLEYTWKGSQYWALVTLPPGEVPATAQEDRYVRAVSAMARVSGGAAAVKAYQGALARWPASVAAAVGLGNAWYALHDLPQAEQALRAGLAAHPGSPALLNNLAQVLSDEGRQEEALALVTRAAGSAGDLAPAVQETRAMIESRLR